MAQSVRGQTLIDAIVDVFQDAGGERALTADEVARRVRASGFWGGKEPKAAEQMVASYLATRHAAMFDPGAGETFTIKSAFLRGGAGPTAPPARSEPLELSPVTPAPSAGSHATGRLAPAAPRGAVPETGKRKKRKSFGGATVAHITPAGVQQSALLQRINLHLSFEEALKLHLGLGQLLGALNGRSPAGTNGRKPAAQIRIDLARQRISLFKRPL